MSKIIIDEPSKRYKSSNKQYHKLCRCAGTNENCQFCFGRGWIDADDSKGTRHHCELTTVDSKKRKSRYTQTARPSGHSSIKVENNLTPLERFKVRHYRNQNKNLNKIASTYKKSFQAESTDYTNDKLTTCIICQVKVRKDRIVRHLKRVHKKSSSIQKANKIAHKIECRKKDCSSKSNDITVAHAPNNDSRDGGKYLGYMQRESNGRFGSMPLYDNYGEESSAD